MSMATRTASSRMASGRASIGGDPRLRLQVDTSGIPSNMEVKWVRESTLGERDTANVQVNMMDGWQPVTTAILPNANPPLFPGEKDETGGIVRRFGQILMMRAKHECDAERAQLRAMDDDAKNAAVRMAADDDASFDGTNFHDDPDNKIVERTMTGAAPRAAKGNSKFADA